MDIVEIFKLLTPFATTAIKPVIETTLQPLLEKYKEWEKENSTKNLLIDNYFQDRFADYLDRTLKACSFANTLVFPNRPIPILDLYQPLTIIANKRDRVRIDINLDLEKLFFTRSILISDTAGMGKSTISKIVCLATLRSSTSIPIIIELRKLSRTHGIIEEITKQLDSFQKRFNEQLILNFLESGNFTIILDGLDEVPRDIISDTISNINSFISKANKNNYILTSRPESSLTALQHFESFQIEPLTSYEARQLLKKIDSLNNHSFYMSLSEDIDQRPQQVNEFLSNPFLVSLLYKTYTYTRDIPSRKTAFYEEVYSSLYKYHDSSKDGFTRIKQSGLDMQDFRIVLAHLAFDTAKNSETVYFIPEFLNTLGRIKKKEIGINFREEHFMNDLLESVPLFLKDGAYIRWAHKSIQDYFAAYFINLHEKSEILVEAIFKSKKDQYLNILNLFEELNPKIFSKLILGVIIDEFVNYASQKDRYDKSIEPKLIDIRNSILFCVQVYIEKSDGGHEALRKFDEKFMEIMDQEMNTFGYVYNDEKSSLLVAHSSLYFHHILDMIPKKKYDIFYNDQYDINVTSIEEVLEKLKLKKSTHFSLNDDNPKLPFNTPENFEIINGLIFTIVMGARYPERLVLDISKCKRFIEGVKKLNEQSSWENELLGI